jgi:hypothetical protein
MRGLWGREGGAGHENFFFFNNYSVKNFFFFYFRFLPLEIRLIFFFCVVVDADGTTYGSCTIDFGSGQVDF